MSQFLGGVDYDRSREIPQTMDEEKSFCATKECWNPAVETDKFCRKCLAWEDEE